MSTDKADREAFSTWMQESGNHSIEDAFKAGLAHARKDARLAREAPAEAERGDRTQWQTGVEGHRRSCSRVSGPVPLACYVYLKDGKCVECGARVSLPAGVVKPPEPGAGAPESSEDNFITRKQLIEALRDIDSPEGTAVLLLLANRLEKT